MAEKTTKTTKAPKAKVATKVETKKTKVAKKVEAPKVDKVVAAENVEAIEAAPKKPAKPMAKASGKGAAKKAATIKKFQSHDSDTGSTEVQVAVLTEKINSLSKHLNSHKKDVDSRMGLLRMISQRRSLLMYLEKRNGERYKKLIGSLGLRK